MKKGLNIAVFCSANASVVERYAHETDELGGWIAECGHNLVFGGCAMGLMKRVADAVLSARESCGKAAARTNARTSQIIGVVPSLIEEGGNSYSPMDEIILCRNLSERKDIMLDRCDLAIALPGGIGTLDEIFTMAASSTIGYHHKKVLLYNIDGFWDSVISLLDDLSSKGVLRGDWHEYIRPFSSIDELTGLI